MPQDFYHPNSNPYQQVDDRKKLFGTLNTFVTRHNGWLVSIPGDVPIRLQVLPGSTLPDALRKLGYFVERTGQTQRILPNAITEELELSASGAMVPVTAGSTRPVTTRITHAGLATVVQYDLRLP